jgi:uncharacterized membrane protein YphA (DoxX/SURF4 family)
VELTKTQLFISWGLRLIAAGILLQTLFFKFTGAEESKYIFSTLGVEPWGRIGSGVVELVAAILLLVPRTTAIGALIALATMSGAILSHLAFLGIEVKNDRGLLFGLAATVFVAALGVLYLHRFEIPILGAKLRPYAA